MRRIAQAVARLWLLIVALLLVVAGVYVLIERPIPPVSGGDDQYSYSSVSTPLATPTKIATTATASKSSASVRTSAGPTSPSLTGVPSVSPTAITSMSSTARSTPSSSRVSPTSTSVSSSNTPVARSCQAGKPVRLVWHTKGIDIDASIEAIGLNEDTSLAAPASKQTIGWYAGGPWPGQGKGNVLIDGHTYADDSAVFKESFDESVALGNAFSIVMDNGSTCSYKVTRIWKNIAKIDQYAQLVKKYDFYDFDGPEQVFGVTCSGTWDPTARSHKAVTAFMAVPIN